MGDRSKAAARKAEIGRKFEEAKKRKSKDRDRQPGPLPRVQESRGARSRQWSRWADTSSATSASSRLTRSSPCVRPDDSGGWGSAPRFVYRGARGLSSTRQTRERADLRRNTHRAARPRRSPDQGSPPAHIACDRTFRLGGIPASSARLRAGFRPQDRGEQRPIRRMRSLSMFIQHARPRRVPEA